MCAYVVAEGSADQEVSSTWLDFSDLEEIKKQLNPVLREYLSRTLHDYMIPSRVVFLDNILLSPNGKVDRRALPEPEFEATAVQYAPPRGESEEKLVEIWSQVLGMESSSIGIDANFFEIGGHSLKATMLAAKIHKAFNVNIKLADIFRKPSIRGLASLIAAAAGIAGNSYMPIEPAAEKEYYPLSSAQERLYLLHRIAPGTGYNMPAFMIAAGHIDKQRFKDTFLKLIQRHESFRTSFEMRRGEPVQIVHPTGKIEFDIEYYDLAAEQTGPPMQSPAAAKTEDDENYKDYTIQHFARRFIRSFDLLKAPLFRVGLVKLPPALGSGAVHQETKGAPPEITGGGSPGAGGGAPAFLLVLDMHHIISDGTSMGIFIEEFMSLYGGELLPVPLLQYRDFADWQRRERFRDAAKKKLQQQEKYWLKRLAGEIPVLNLPYDYARPLTQSFAGDTARFEIGEEETAALSRMALKNNATLYMVLLSIFNILLAKLSGQEDILVGTPVSGRSHPDTERVIGMFVNTLVLRNETAGEDTYVRCLEEVRENTLAAFDNRDYQFEDLIEKVGAEIKRDVSRNPLFDVMFALQNLDLPAVEIPGLTLKPYLHRNSIAKFDMTLTCEETGKNLNFSLEYCTKLFKEETITRIIIHFRNITAAVLENPGVKIADIEMMPPQEKARLLLEFNETAVSFPADKTIHRLFEEQVEKYPDHTAIVEKRDAALSYRQFDEEAGSLAGLLIKKGLETGDIAAILLERSIRMVTVVFAVLKAGGVYLPIDPGYPAERKRYILKDSGAKVLLTGREIFAAGEKIEHKHGETIFLDEYAPGKEKGKVDHDANLTRKR